VKHRAVSYNCKCWCILNYIRIVVSLGGRGPDEVPGQTDILSFHSIRRTHQWQRDMVEYIGVYLKVDLMYVLNRSDQRQ
jgi:hypothetical protein